MKIFKHVVFATVLFFFLTASVRVFAQAPGVTKFETVVLGSGGGLNQDNLSAYLLALKKTSDYICLDAGTLYSGINKALENGGFGDIIVPADSPLSPAGWILQNQIKAYLITHIHLDHIAGLVFASTQDSPKNIYATMGTIKYFKDNIFNRNVWPNFGNEGKPPILNKYTYKMLDINKQVQVENTVFKVEPLILSHQEPNQSTAFLIEHENSFVLYIGDTGADYIEKSNNLHNIWHKIAPLIKQKNLHAIFMECSYTNARQDYELFGHLNPKWVIEELTKLAKICNAMNYQAALKDLPVIVTGIKPSIMKSVNTREIIKKELKELNNLKVNFIFPEQGKKIEF